MLDKAFAERILHDYKVGLKNVQGGGTYQVNFFSLN